MDDHDQQAVTVRDNPGEGRFDVFVGDVHAGISMYEDVEQGAARHRIFHHTVVFDTFEGRGLASTLTRAAVETSVRAGHRIVPVCPYVRRWLATHDGFDDVTDPVRPQHIRALR